MPDPTEPISDEPLPQDQPAASDPDEVDVDDIDLGEPDSSSGAEPGDEGAPPVKAATQGFIEYDGEKWPAEFKDGTWVPGTALAKYLKATAGGNGNQARDPEPRRGATRGRSEAEPRGEPTDPLKSFKDRIAAIKAETNPHDPDDDPKEYHAFEMGRRDRIDSVKDDAQEARFSTVQERIEARERADSETQAQRQFEDEYASVARTIGIPKGDSEGDKFLRNAVQALVGMDPRLQGYSSDGEDAIPMEKLASYWYKGLQKAVDERAAAMAKSVKKAGVSATVAVHRGGSPSVAPTTRPVVKRTAADYTPDAMAKRILRNAVNATAASRGRL